MSFLGNLHHRITNPSEGGTAAYVSVTSTGDVLRWSPGCPVQIMRWGLIATTTVTVALVLTGDVRPTAGSDAGRITGASTSIGSQTGYNATNQPAFYYDTVGGSLTATGSLPAAGKGVFHNVWPQAPSGTPALYPAPDTAFTSPGGVDTQLVIYPGQEFIIRVATAATAGAGILFVEAKDLPFVGDSNNLEMGLSGVPSSISPTPSNATVNLTRINA